MCACQGDGRAISLGHVVSSRCRLGHPPRSDPSNADQPTADTSESTVRPAERTEATSPACAWEVALKGTLGLFGLFGL